jgi:hypothetical protein
MDLDYRGAPRPRPALRVGVTGHRLVALHEAGVDLAALRGTARAALGQLLRAVEDVAEECSATYAGGALVHLVSPLHDGADQIVADEAVRLGYTLHVPLPYLANIYTPAFPSGTESAGDDPRHVFDRLIARADVVRVLNGDPGAVMDPAHDAAVERFVLRHTDVLIAVGDGRSGRGPPAGDDIIEQARSRHVPVLHIDPRRPEEWGLHGGPRPGRPSHLVEIVRRVLGPPTPPTQERVEEVTGVAVDSLAEYLDTPARGALGGLYTFLVKLVAGERLPLPVTITRGRQFLARAAEDWTTMVGASTDTDPEITDPLTRALMRYYVWAEGLGYRYGMLHRDASSAPYVFAPIAVFFALAAHFWEPRPWGISPAWWVVGEAAVLILILRGFYQHAVKGRYHDRWIDYRSLAEQLRQLTFLWLLGQPPRGPHLHGEAEGEAPQLAWVDWYVQAAAREAGVFPGVLTPARLLTVRQVLADQFIRHQCAYHDRTARRAGTVYRRLHKFAFWVFVAALGLAVVDLVVFALPSVLAPVARVGPWLAWADRAAASIAPLPGWLGLAIGTFAIILPAIGASVHGFVSQGDFRNLSHRSHRMCETLGTLADRVDASPATMDALGRLATQAAAAMSEEIVYWRVFVRLKPPALV